MILKMLHTLMAFAITAVSFPVFAAFAEDCGHSELATDEPFTVPNDNDRQARIVGGNEVEDGAWPWLVALVDMDHQHFCGAAIIAEQWILTAAHCLHGLTSDKVRVLAGRTDMGNLQNLNRSLYSSVKEVFVHPKWDPATTSFDLALLQLTDKLQFNENIQPICLSSSDPWNEEDVARFEGWPLVTVVGWGLQNENDKWKPSVARQTQVVLFRQSQCAVFGNWYGKLCAGMPNGGHDTCGGDSGGPLMQRLSDGRWYIRGVTSYSLGSNETGTIKRNCGRQRVPSIYANVQEMMPFIEQTLQNNQLSTTTLPFRNFQ